MDLRLANGEDGQCVCLVNLSGDYAPGWQRKDRSVDPTVWDIMDRELGNWDVSWSRG